MCKPPRMCAHGLKQFWYTIVSKLPDIRPAFFTVKCMALRTNCSPRTGCLAVAI